MFKQVDITDMVAFQRIKWKNHSSINLIIGENDTGKTHLLKILYCIVKSIEEFTRPSLGLKTTWNEFLAEKLLGTFLPRRQKLGELVRKGKNKLAVETKFKGSAYGYRFGRDTINTIKDYSKDAKKQNNTNAIFLPPKEVLTAFHTITDSRSSNLEFDDTYLDLIKVIRKQNVQGRLIEEFADINVKLEEMFSGKLDQTGEKEDEFIFRRGAEAYNMSLTAEGIKKVSILTKLIRNRTLTRDTVLFIDELEANLHPAAISLLTELLFNISRIGIQIYISTHNYFVIKNFELLARKYKESISACSLSRTSEGVKAMFADLKEGIPDNAIVRESLKLLDRDFQIGMTE